jgi:hypothetical protein
MVWKFTDWVSPKAVLYVMLIRKIMMPQSPIWNYGTSVASHFAD